MEYRFHTDLRFQLIHRFQLRLGFLPADLVRFFTFRWVRRLVLHFDRMFAASYVHELAEAILADAGDQRELISLPPSRASDFTIGD